MNYGSAEEEWEDGDELDMDQNHQYLTKIVGEALTLDWQEQRKLVALAQKGDQKARHRLMASCYHLVLKRIKKMRIATINIPDCFNEGILGLSRAIEGFNLNRTGSGGTKMRFSTYAVPWIDQAIKRFLTDKSRLIKIASHPAEVAQKILEMADEMSDREIAAELRLSEETVRAVRTVSNPLSLDAQIISSQDDENREIRDILADLDISLDPQIEAERAELREEVERLCKTLSEDDGRGGFGDLHLIRWRFGLDDGSPATLEEIGRRMGGLCRERVRQREKKALEKMEKKASASLREYANYL